MFYQIKVLDQFITKESANAYQMKCPDSSRYAKYRFWIPKKLVKRERYGDLKFMIISLPETMKFELTRYYSKRQAPIQAHLSGIELMECFSHEQWRLGMRMEFEVKNREADRLFEREMKRQGF